MAIDNGPYSTISTIHNGYYPQQIALQFETLNIRLALYSLKQKAVSFNTCRIVKKFSAEERIRSVWSLRPLLF